MLKKIFVLLFLTLSFSSCFWKADDTKLEENKKVSSSSSDEEKNKLATIAGDWFIIKLPKSLVKVKDLPTPRVWKVVLAMQAREMINWFINNIVIIKQILDKKISSEEFSIINQVKAKSKYVNYKKLDMKNLIFADWDIGVLYFFEARYNNNTAKQHFLQVWKVCWTEAYILTIWLNPRIFDYKKYETYLKSFKCKK